MSASSSASTTITKPSQPEPRNSRLTAYGFLERPPRYEIKTAPAQQPERVKQQIVRERGFETIHVLEEMIAEFDYQPTACRRSYRVIVRPQAAGESIRANCGCSRSIAISSTSPTTATARPKRSCSRPMIGATRRT